MEYKTSHNKDWDPVNQNNQLSQRVRTKYINAWHAIDTLESKAIPQQIINKVLKIDVKQDTPIADLEAALAKYRKDKAKSWTREGALIDTPRDKANRADYDDAKNAIEALKASRGQ